MGGEEKEEEGGEVGAREARSRVVLVWARRRREARTMEATIGRSCVRLSCLRGRQKNSIGSRVASWRATFLLG